MSQVHATVCQDGAQHVAFPLQTECFSPVGIIITITTLTRPITCLPVLWKLFISIISEEIYHHLDTNRQLPIILVIGVEFFKGTGLFHLLFVINLIPMSRVLCKVRAGYDLGHGGSRINHLIYV